ncbi:MAG: flagellin [Acidobacteriota bacterium]
MAMSNGSRINTNIQALNAYNALNTVSQQIGVHQLRLASGKRVNSVADDASGYTIAKQMEARSRVYSASLNNVGDAKSLLSTAEGALQTVRDLIIQSQEKIAGANNPAADKTAIANDVAQLGSEISDIITNTNFNGTKLFSTAFSQSFQVGYTSTESVTVAFDATGVTASTLTGVNSGSVANTDISTIASSAESALQKIGSLIQRLDVKEENLNTAVTNIEASRSRIMDADVAMEQVKVTKLGILQQMGVAQLSQANSSPQQFLQLFR